MRQYSQSSSDFAYFRALRKTQIFQALTDSVVGDGNDVVDEIRCKLGGADDNAIVDPAKDAEKNSIVMTIGNMEFLTSSPSPSHDTLVFYVNSSTFKFWFLVLLAFFLFISAGLFHLFCIGQKNVTRRNSTEKEGPPTETTTMEMIAERVKDDTEPTYEMTAVHSRLVSQD